MASFFAQQGSYGSLPVRREGFQISSAKCRIVAFSYAIGINSSLDKMRFSRIYMAGAHPVKPPYMASKPILSKYEYKISA